MNERVFTADARGSDVSVVTLEVDARAQKAGVPWRRSV